MAWFWSGHKTNEAWEDRVAAQEAVMRQAHTQELARQADASREIAAAATERALRGEALAGELQGQIDDLKAMEPANVPAAAVQGGAPRACFIDDDFSRVVRQFDASARTATPARRAR